MNLSAAMTKVILLTGATDGIGLETARRLVAQGHQVLLHGRSAKKLKSVAQELDAGNNNVETYRCDLSKLSNVQELVKSVKEKHPQLDVIINNAGVFAVSETTTPDGLDVRFAVNTLAPYMITRGLWDTLDSNSRVVNLSSAAQAPVNLDALRGNMPLNNDNQAYAQSKLALTQWSVHMAEKDKNGPIVVAINPASLLGTKMVHQAYGIPGKDLSVGADILVRAALSDEFGRAANGKYYDNDNHCFASPHRDATNPQKNLAVVAAMDDVIAGLGLN